LRGIAYKRHQYEKRKAKVVRDQYWARDWHDPSGFDKFKRTALLGMCANTPNFCGCTMCRNPRKRHGWPSDHVLTIQERKAEDAANDSYFEYVERIIR